MAKSRVRAVEQNMIDFSLLRTGNELARGGFGVVYRGECDGKPVVVKELM
jgi:predicted Ser/Thr protein kinase